VAGAPAGGRSGGGREPISGGRSSTAGGPFLIHREPTATASGAARSSPRTGANAGGVVTNNIYSPRDSRSTDASGVTVPRRSYAWPPPPRQDEHAAAAAGPASAGRTRSPRRSTATAGPTAAAAPAHAHETFRGSLRSSSAQRGAGATSGSGRRRDVTSPQGAAVNASVAAARAGVHAPNTYVTTRSVSRDDVSAAMVAPPGYALVPAAAAYGQSRRGGGGGGGGAPVSFALDGPFAYTSAPSLYDDEPALAAAAAAAAAGYRHGRSSGGGGRGGRYTDTEDDGGATEYAASEAVTDDAGTDFGAGTGLQYEYTAPVVHRRSYSTQRGRESTVTGRSSLGGQRSAERRGQSSGRQYDGGASGLAFFEADAGTSNRRGTDAFGSGSEPRFASSTQASRHRSMSPSRGGAKLAAAIRRIPSGSGTPGGRR
jgi:hypothetical protein